MIAFSQASTDLATVSMTDSLLPDWTAQCRKVIHQLFAISRLRRFASEPLFLVSLKDVAVVAWKLNSLTLTTTP